MKKNTTVPLWNPTVAANWSLLFSPILGAWLHAKNWAALGNEVKEKQSMYWVRWGAVGLLLHSSPEERRNHLIVAPDCQVRADSYATAQRLRAIRPRQCTLPQGELSAVAAAPWFPEWFLNAATRAPRNRCVVPTESEEARFR